MAIEIREHEPGKDLDDFLEVAFKVYDSDPNWVAPLHMEISDRLTPWKNPFFEHGEVALFTAWKDGQIVGRISAQIDHEHLKRYEDETGFFGFFDTLDDPEVAQALVGRAKHWLKERGMKRIRGPMSLNINEEVGTLIDGFDHPPQVMMGHARQYQGALAEAAGLEKAKDLFAWKFYAGTSPKRALSAYERIASMPEVRFRSVDKKNMERDLTIVMDIFNDAWSDNWGFVPATEAEMKKGAQDMKLIIDEDMAFIAEIDGRPMGMCVCLPNLNEVIRDLDGKLFPFGIFKLLWRLKVKKPKTARLMMLGIRKELQRNRKYGALSVAMYVELARRGEGKGFEWGELSWTLDDNHAINSGIKAMGAEVYKTYRIYEGDIE